MLTFMIDKGACYPLHNAMNNGSYLIVPPFKKNVQMYEWVTSTHSNICTSLLTN